MTSMSIKELREREDSCKRCAAQCWSQVLLTPRLRECRISIELTDVQTVAPSGVHSRQSEPKASLIERDDLQRFYLFIAGRKSNSVRAYSSNTSTSYNMCCKQKNDKLDSLIISKKRRCKSNITAVDYPIHGIRENVWSSSSPAGTSLECFFVKRLAMVRLFHPSHQQYMIKHVSSSALMVFPYVLVSVIFFL